MSEQQKRIEWIDLAKGICILLVVWWHIKELYSNRGFTDRSYLLYTANYFRMPLYFFLSGLFFKTYGGYLTFLIRKTNKLLIPFLTFAIIGIAYCLLFPHKLPALRTWESYYPFVTVWFLLCLFLMNNLFFLVMRLAEGNHITLYICVCLLGVIGYYSGRNYLEFLHLRTALTAMPFFVVGYALRAHTRYLSYRARWWELVPAVGAFAALYLWTRYNGKPQLLYTHNEYSLSIGLLYLTGFVGIYGIMTIARLLRRVPIVSYLGRYSIIVLITHYPLVYLVPKQWNRILYWGFGGWCAAEELALLVCLEVPLVALCVKYLPYIFAQKDLIRIKPKV